MANFDLAVNKTLKFEGGYTNNPNDSGKATNYGITIGVMQGFGLDYDLDHDGDVDDTDVKLLTVAQAKDIYKKLYWDGDNINSQPIAEKHFDMSVNMGVVTANKYLQQACERRGIPSIVCDGVLGPKSIAAINAIKDSELMTNLCRIQAEHYWKCVIRDVEKNGSSRNWPKELLEDIKCALTIRDATLCQQYLKTLKNLKLKEGNLDFLRGWLRRASERFGI